MILHLLLIIQTLTVTSFQTKKIIPLASQNGKAELALDLGRIENTTGPILTEIRESSPELLQATNPMMAAFGEGMVMGMGEAAIGNMMNAATPFLKDAGLGVVVDAMCFGGVGDCSDGPDNQMVIDEMTRIGAELQNSIGLLQEDVTGLTNDVAAMDNFVREACKEFRQEFVNIGANQAKIKTQLEKNYNAIESGFQSLDYKVEALGDKVVAMGNELMLSHTAIACNEGARGLEKDYGLYRIGLRQISWKIPSDSNYADFKRELTSFQDTWEGNFNSLNDKVTAIESCLAPTGPAKVGYFESYYHVLKNKAKTPKFKLEALADAFEFYMGALTEADEMLYTSVFCKNRHDYATARANSMHAHLKALAILARVFWGQRLRIIAEFWKWAEQIFNDAAFTCKLDNYYLNWQATFNLCSSFQNGDCPKLQEFAKFWQDLSTRWPHDWTRPQKTLASFGINTISSCSSHVSAVDPSCVNSGTILHGTKYYKKKGAMVKYCENFAGMYGADLGVGAQFEFMNFGGIG